MTGNNDARAVYQDRGCKTIRNNAGDDLRNLLVRVSSRIANVGNQFVDTPVFELICDDWVRMKGPFCLRNGILNGDDTRRLEAVNA